MIRLLLALTVLPSCIVHQQEVNLDEFEGGRMYLGASPGSIFAEFEPTVHPCPILGAGVTATLEGGATSVDVAITDRGGEDSADETGRCLTIRMRLDTPPAIDPAELVIADSTLEARIDLGGLLVAPSASLVPAGPWEIGSDHMYRVAMGQRAVMVSATSVTVGVVVAGSVVTANAALDGNGIVFTTPTLPASGQAMLSIDVSGMRFPDWDCGPLKVHCQLVSNRRPVEVPVTLVP